MGMESAKVAGMGLSNRTASYGDSNALFANPAAATAG